MLGGESLARLSHRHVKTLFNAVYVLLDSGSTLSYVTLYVAVGFGFKPDVIAEPFSVSTPVEDSIVARGYTKILLCLFLVGILGKTS